MTNKTITPQTRPACPMCTAPMVYAAIVVDDKTIWAWLCNCRNQPDHILADIANARLQPEVSLVYELEIANA